MKAPFVALLLSAALFFSCKKETEEFQTEPLTEYLPAQPGKYITYRLDSTVFTNFGTATAVRSYQEKNQVDALLTDNLGRPSYRVYRYQRDLAGTQAWRPAGTLFITPTEQTIEVIENNLRYIKLAAPISQDKSWRGNRFLPSEPYKDKFQFGNDDDGEADASFPMWRYTYTDTNGTFAYKGQNLSPVVTVLHIADSVNVPVTQPAGLGYINYSINKFAKGIGLVYEELTMWEYQPNPGGASGYRVGFGVKRSMIDHN